MTCPCNESTQCETHAAEWRRVSETEREAVITFLKLEGETAEAVRRGVHLTTVPS